MTRTWIFGVASAAALLLSSALAQEGSQGTASVPDLSGVWGNPYLYGIEVRRVRMNEPHPAQVTPSWYGDSVGHYEGDTLVIDTVGFKIGPFSAVDQYGTPFTQALHVVERYRLIDYEAARAAWERGGKENSRGGQGIGEGWAPDPTNKGKGLQLQFTVEDKEVFTTPWSATKTYRRVFRDWPEQVCAENPHKYGTEKDAAVPTADKPDF